LILAEIETFRPRRRQKLLPFAIASSATSCWLYGSDILHRDRLYGAVEVFLKRDNIGEARNRKLLVIAPRAFTGCKLENVI